MGRLARVEVGGPARAETYVLILNTTASPARARVSVLSRPWARDVELPPLSRVSLPMSRAFPEIADNGPLGIMVESGRRGNRGRARHVLRTPPACRGRRGRS